MHTIMNFIESLNTLVLEGSSVSENGIIQKSINAVKDRGYTGIINKRFYACEASDFYKLAKAWEDGDFHFPEDPHFANLWVYGDLIGGDDQCTKLMFSKITQVPYLQIYDRMIGSENFPSANPYDSDTASWCTKNGISLLIGDIMEYAKYVLLFCPDCHVVIPLKMGATFNEYHLVLINLSELAEKRNMIKEALAKNTMLVIVQDIDELRELIPPLDTECPMLVSNAGSPHYVHASYDKKHHQFLSYGEICNFIKTRDLKKRE